MRKTFGALMAQTTRQWRRVVDKRLQPFGLTEATWLPLIHIARATEPMHQKVLASSLSLDSSSIVRLVDELESRGLVERREGKDRRAKAIHLTESSQTTVERVEAVADEIRNKVLAGLPEQDLAVASRVIEHVYKSLLILEDQA